MVPDDTAGTERTARTNEQADTPSGQELTIDLILSVDGSPAGKDWPGWCGLESAEYLDWLAAQDCWQIPLTLWTDRGWAVPLTHHQGEVPDFAAALESVAALGGNPYRLRDVEVTLPPPYLLSREHRARRGPVCEVTVRSDPGGQTHALLNALPGLHGMDDSLQRAMPEERLGDGRALLMLKPWTDPSGEQRTRVALRAHGTDRILALVVTRPETLLWGGNAQLEALVSADRPATERGLRGTWEDVRAAAPSGASGTDEALQLQRRAATAEVLLAEVFGDEERRITPFQTIEWAAELGIDDRVDGRSTVYLPLVARHLEGGNDNFVHAVLAARRVPGRRVAGGSVGRRSGAARRRRRVSELGRDRAGRGRSSATAPRRER